MNSWKYEKQKHRKREWGKGNNPLNAVNDFLKKKLEPTGEIYAKVFYAKNHIPSSFRPGNNSKLLEYDYYDVENYNVKCFNNSLNTNQVLI